MFLFVLVKFTTKKPSLPDTIISTLQKSNSTTVFDKLTLSDLKQRRATRQGTHCSYAPTNQPKLYTQQFTPPTVEALYSEVKSYKGFSDCYVHYFTTECHGVVIFKDDETCSQAFSNTDMKFAKSVQQMKLFSKQEKVKFAEIVTDIEESLTDDDFSELRGKYNCVVEKSGDKLLIVSEKVDDVCGDLERRLETYFYGHTSQQTSSMGRVSEHRVKYLPELDANLIHPFYAFWAQNAPIFDQNKGSRIITRRIMDFCVVELSGYSCTIFSNFELNLKLCVYRHKP